MGSATITATTGANFNPAITSREIIDIREANLGFEATTSRRYVDDARVGTTIAWPVIQTLTAAAKCQGYCNTITYTANTECAVTLTVNQHYYAAFNLEEREEALALHDITEIYSRRAAYGVNLQMDDSLACLVDNFSQVVGTLAVDLTDDDVRRAQQYLDDANVPDSDRYLGIAPATKNSLLAIDRYNSSDFRSSGAGNIVRGTFGQIYGTTVFHSTNIDGCNSAGHDNTMHHRDAIAIAVRFRPRTRTFCCIDRLSTAHAVSALWGVIETRDCHGVFMRGA